MYEDKQRLIKQLMSFYSRMDESELLKLTKKTMGELSQQIKEERGKRYKSLLLIKTE